MCWMDVPKLGNANAYLGYFADPYTCRCRRGRGLWAGGNFLDGSHIWVKCKYTFQVNLCRETYGGENMNANMNAVLSCVSHTHYNEWLQHLCITNTQINTEIKWQVEPDDKKLHLMPVYLFSFCVSIFYPFYRDTLIFIVHRCHHCLMYTTCKRSNRTQESQERNVKKKSQIHLEMGSSWLECLTP